MHIGKRIKYIRHLKGFSQTNVCKGIISPSHLSNIEGGRYDASYDILRLLSERLEVPVSYFVRGSEHSEKIDKLLKDYDEALRKNLSDADELYEANKHELSYISSVQQEFHFLLLFCDHHLRKGDMAKAEEKYDQLSQYLDDDPVDSLPKAVRFRYFYVSGLLHFFKREYSESYNFFTEALLHVYQDADEARVRFNCGLIFFRINDLYRSLFYVEEAKSLFMDLHNWPDTVKAYNLLGIIFIEKKDYQTAESMLVKGLQLARNHNLKEEESKILHNLAILEGEQHNYDQSVDYIKQSLTVKEKYLYIKGDPFIQNSIFSTYLELLLALMKSNQFDKVEALLKKAQKYCVDETHFYRVQALSAEKDFQQANFSDYEKKITEAIHYFYSNELWTEIETIAQKFSEHLATKRQHKKANDYLRMELEALTHLYKERF